MYLSFDVETGGLGHDKSLLTAYFIVLDEEFNKVADLSLRVKPNDGIYKVTAKALEINKIDLIKHDAVAITEQEAGTKLYEFLEQVNPDGKIKLEPLGHNVGFDIEFICASIITKNTWLKYVSYRLLDTGGIGNFLKKAGYIPKEISGSLGSYAQFFGISQEGAHTAEDDVRMTVDVYQGMLNLVNHAGGDY